MAVAAAVGLLATNLPADAAAAAGPSRPLGSLTSVVASGPGVRLTGWAIDPDTTAAVPVAVSIDGRPAGQVSAALSLSTVATAYPRYGARHGFAATFVVASGRHQICASALNVGPGAGATSLGCRTLILAVSPFGYWDSATPLVGSVRLDGWAIEPDSRVPAVVAVSVDGRATPRPVYVATRVDVAARYLGDGNQLGFTIFLPLTAGTHLVCLNAVNVGAGRTRSLGCRSIAWNGSPLGAVSPVPRAVGSTLVTVQGWAADPDSNQTISVVVTIDGTAPVTTPANRTVTGLQTGLAGHGPAHGFALARSVSFGAHRLCVTAINIGTGSNRGLGCQSLPSGLATASSAPRSVGATGSYQSARVTWVAPASTGGSTVTRYTITATPGGTSTTAAGTSRAAMVGGLATGTAYRFTVRAVNGVGVSSASAPSAWTRPAAAGIVGVTAPPLISTSRYIRNINGSINDAAKMRQMGATDGYYNPSGHGYLVLLQIGGQTRSNIILTATSISVTYPQTVLAMKAYLDGYASTQRSNAPATIAFGTNNDVDVDATTGAIWAQYLVNPLLTYAAKYRAITVAGANDIEPGFIAAPAATHDWLVGYLRSTSAKFVFNGSADGCAWYAAHGRCNNGWTANSLHWFTGAAAPTRIIALPQIYNTTMAAQWKYVSLTGVLNGHLRVNFGGPLTEWTACYPQHGGCGSLTNNTAWAALSAQLRSDARIFQWSLPYGTDLRIN